MNETPRYEFRLAEPLSESAQHAFPGLRVAVDGDTRVLYGTVRSQEELAGLLTRFNTMRLTLLDVHRLPD